MPQRLAPVALLLALLPGTGHADVVDRLRIDASATFSRIEQQAKVEVGATRGERLVEQTEVGSEIIVTTRIWGPLSAGLFAHVDLGTRRAGRFAGFDSEGATMLVDESGGPYREFWLGPLLRAQYTAAFVELGYGLLTLRKDTGRDDLPSQSGDRSTAFRTLPTVSWSMAVGGEFRVTRKLDVAARLIWRIRYYDRRGGDPLADGIVHGTQSYQPFVGIVWYPGRE